MKTRDGRGSVIYGSDGQAVAMRHPLDSVERWSRNAPLIAAAPDLLEACKAALRVLETADNYFPKSIKHSDRFQLLNVEENSVRAAIRKATGGEA
jgi:hypothetical protein